MSDDKTIKELQKKINKLRGDPNTRILREYGKKNGMTLNKLVLKNRKVLKGHFAKVYAISWSTHKKIVSASQDGKMIIWDAFTTNKVLSIPLKSSWVMTCAFSPSEKLIASGGLDNICSVFTINYGSIEDKIPLKELEGHEGYISSIKFFDDEKLVSASGDSTCKLWDVQKRKVVNTFDDHESDVMSVAVKKSPNLFVSGSCDATAKMYDPRVGTNAVMNFVGHESDINSVCFVNDLDCIATGSDDSSCRLFDLRSVKQLNRYVSDNILCGITSVASSSGGKYIFAGYDDYNVYAWDTVYAEPSMTLSAHENRVSCIDICRDGQALASGSWDTFVKIWA